jgi:prepilin-type N-terminal cleavage/methylation domain-containing protein
MISSQKGFSLLEVMIATAICGLMSAMTLTLMVQIDNHNRSIHDRAIAYRASHQAMEVLLAEDVDSMILQDGNSYVVTECLKGPQLGNITVTDMAVGWGIAPNQAYEITLDMPQMGVTLRAIRTRT